jgi:hypothetical protein
MVQICNNYKLLGLVLYVGSSIHFVCVQYGRGSFSLYHQNSTLNWFWCTLNELGSVNNWHFHFAKLCSHNTFSHWITIFTIHTSWHRNTKCIMLLPDIWVACPKVIVLPSYVATSTWIAKWVFGLTDDINILCMWIISNLGPEWWDHILWALWFPQHEEISSWRYLLAPNLKGGRHVECHPSSQFHIFAGKYVTTQYLWGLLRILFCGYLCLLPWVLNLTTHLHLRLRICGAVSWLSHMS